VISVPDRELLEALVGWYETIRGSHPWKIVESAAWGDLIAADMVARAPEDHVYPLPRGIEFIHRSRARTKKEIYDQS